VLPSITVITCDGVETGGVVPPSSTPPGRILSIIDEEALSTNPSNPLTTSFTIFEEDKKGGKVKFVITGGKVKVVITGDVDGGAVTMRESIGVGLNDTDGWILGISVSLLTDGANVFTTAGVGGVVPVVGDEVIGAAVSFVTTVGDFVSPSPSSSDDGKSIADVHVSSSKSISSPFK
jgi:hypothetical protein